jgi:hypothetical protein
MHPLFISPLSTGGEKIQKKSRGKNPAAPYLLTYITIKLTLHLLGFERKLPEHGTIQPAREAFVALEG